MGGPVLVLCLCRCFFSSGQSGIATSMASSNCRSDRHINRSIGIDESVCSQYENLELEKGH
jgi:hypothetical protein